ncbi:efflux RND transporter permease subunit, partial [Pandoraea nosoerga]
SYGITLSQLITAIGNANNNTGGNLLRDGEQQFVVRGVGLLQTVEDIRNVVVAANNGVPVRVRDIAEVEVGNVQRLGMVQYNDQPDVVEGIVLLKRDANATEVLAKVRDKVAELNNSILPK